MQEQQAKQIREVNVYREKVYFLCNSLWPDHPFRIDVMHDQSRMLYRVNIVLAWAEKPQRFHYIAEMYPTGIYGPVPREVIAQINMVLQ